MNGVSLQCCRALIPQPGHLSFPSPWCQETAERFLPGRGVRAEWKDIGLANISPHEKGDTRKHLSQLVMTYSFTRMSRSWDSKAISFGHSGMPSVNPGSGLGISFRPLLSLDWLNCNWILLASGWDINTIEPYVVNSSEILFCRILGCLYKDVP